MPASRTQLWWPVVMIQNDRCDQYTIRDILETIAWAVTIVMTFLLLSSQVKFWRGITSYQPHELYCHDQRWDSRSWCDHHMLGRYIFCRWSSWQSWEICGACRWSQATGSQTPNKNFMTKWVTKRWVLTKMSLNMWLIHQLFQSHPWTSQLCTRADLNLRFSHARVGDLNSGIWQHCSHLVMLMTCCSTGVGRHRRGIFLSKSKLSAWNLLSIVLCLFCCDAKTLLYGDKFSVQLISTQFAFTKKEKKMESFSREKKNRERRHAFVRVCNCSRRRLIEDWALGGCGFGFHLRQEETSVCFGG